MTIENANENLKVIHENERGINDSFIYFLNEENSFNEPAFWQLYNSILGIIEKPLSDVVNRERARTLCRIQTHIMSCTIQHLMPEEIGNKIDDLPLEKIEDYLERLAYAVDGYFTGLITDEKLLEQADGLRNPKTTEE